jgi:pimeloyl-ACP methyl ester carboxylesterase
MKMNIKSAKHALNATIRSFIVGFYRLKFGIGARLAPQRTAALAAALFNTPQRPKPEKLAAPKGIAQPVMRLMPLPSGSVTVYQWGDPESQPTVLMLHGWSGWGMQFADFVPGLLEYGFAVVAPVHVGHGNSLGKLASLPGFIVTTGELMARLPKLSGIVAHSMGGAAAACALAEYGAQELSLVLIAPPAGPRIFVEQFARMLGVPPTVADGMQHWLERRLGRSFESLGAEAVAPRIRAPVLVLHDPADNVVPFAHGEAYVRLAPDARLEAQAGGGHYRILREPGTIRLALEFLARQAMERTTARQARA